MIPYGHQSIDVGDIRAVAGVLKSDWLTQGPKVAEFEKALAKYCGAKFAVAVSSGTAALHLAYLVAGIGKGDEVITSPNTFVATTNMMLAVGAKPVFCDIRKDTYNIDETKIENLITPRTKAIVPVHFAGHPCEMDEILKIAKRNKLVVIEDACHALGAKYKNKKIGSLSDMTVFSFHPVKSITTGEGGAVVTNNREYYKKMILLRSHGITKDKNGFNIMTELGYNYRLTDIQAALGSSQLKKLEEFIYQRSQIAKEYKKELAGMEEIILPTEHPDVKSSWHLYVIRVKDEKDRQPLGNYLKERGIGINFHYPCVYKHLYYQKLRLARVKCPQAEQYSQTSLTIPLYPKMTGSERKKIIGALKDYFR
ncbi:MAG: UDP-4-amino-4,6-dideoxy-N-acetyl-beta-L-altrosamine transaminase [Patescibacteria group bacterium]